MQRFVVTGAAGFIGMHVAETLLKRGDRVLGLDNVNSYYSVALKNARLEELSSYPGFEFERCDLTDHAATLRAVGQARADAVIHLAAQAGVRYSIEHPFEYSSSNLDGFLSILEACRQHRVKHLVYASSSSVYGANARLPFSTSDAVDRPVSLYAATKRSNELMAYTYSHLYGIPTTGLRFFTVYGPWGRPDMAYYKFTDAIVGGREIELFADGELLRDFTYIDDIVAGVLGVLAHPPEGNPSYALYNIGNNSPTRVLEFVSILEGALGMSARRRFAPMQPGDVPATAADIAPLQALCGFVPRTSLEQGLRAFVAWYRRYHAVPPLAAGSE